MSVTKYRILRVDNYSGEETYLATTRTEEQANQAADHYSKSIATNIDNEPVAKILIRAVDMPDNQA